MLSHNRVQRFAVLAGLTAAIMCTVRAAPGDLERLRKGFLNPANHARIMMRWWWIYLPTDDAYATFHAGTDSVDRAMETMLDPELIPHRMFGVRPSKLKSRGC
jgi:hypothetical protein